MMYLAAIIGLTVSVVFCLRHVERKKNTAIEEIEDRLIDFELEVQEIESLDNMRLAYKMKTGILNDAMKIMDTTEMANWMDDVINEQLRYLADTRVRRTEIAI